MSAVKGVGDRLRATGKKQWEMLGYDGGFFDRLGHFGFDKRGISPG